METHTIRQIADKCEDREEPRLKEEWQSHVESSNGHFYLPKAQIDMQRKLRPMPQASEKSERIWTEITKDLISEEALKTVGHEFEETDDFFYVMEHLHYVSIQHISLTIPQ